MFKFRLSISSVLAGVMHVLDVVAREARSQVMYLLAKIVEPVSIQKLEAELAHAKTRPAPRIVGQVLRAASGSGIAREFTSMLKDVNSRMAFSAA